MNINTHLIPNMYSKIGINTYCENHIIRVLLRLFQNEKH